MLAKLNNQTYVMRLVDQYKPLLIKSSHINGQFDEDLYQTLVLTLLTCIQLFNA